VGSCHDTVLSRRGFVSKSLVSAGLGDTAVAFRRCPREPTDEKGGRKMLSSSDPGLGGDNGL
jgi:hypothetical protein